MQESKYKQANSQLESLKVEYQQYKQRAISLLQEKHDAAQSSDDSKLSELQRQLDDLSKENRLDCNTQ